MWETWRVKTCMLNCVAHNSHPQFTAFPVKIAVLALADPAAAAAAAHAAAAAANPALAAGYPYYPG